MKTFRFVGMMSLIIACAGLVGCDETLNGDESETPVSEKDQKEKLSDVAQEAVSLVKAADFEELLELADIIAEESEDDNAEVLDYWLEDCFEACDQSTSEREIYLYRLSNFTGEFEREQNGEWKKSSKAVDYLQLTFNHTRTGKVVAKLTTSGNKAVVHHEAFDEEYYDSYWNGSYWQGYEEIVENRFEIPEKIVCTLTQNGKQLAETTVNTRLNIRNSSGEFDYTTDIVEISTSTKVNNYEFTIKKCYFNPEESASIEETIKINDKEVIKASASFEGEVEEYLEDIEGKVALNINILNQVQLRGSIKEINDFIVAINEMDEYKYEKSVFREYLNECNNLMDVNLYFNGSQTASATLFLEEMRDEDYYYGKYYEAVPAIKFPDGTSYTLDEDYYEDLEEYIDPIIELCEDLIEDFEDLIEGSYIFD